MELLQQIGPAEDLEAKRQIADIEVIDYEVKENLEDVLEREKVEK